jgi:hypothetical protein
MNFLHAEKLIDESVIPHKNSNIIPIYAMGFVIKMSLHSDADCYALHEKVSPLPLTR